MLWGHLHPQKNVYVVHSNLHWLFFYACGFIQILSLFLFFSIFCSHLSIGMAHILKNGKKAGKGIMLSAYRLNFVDVTLSQSTLVRFLLVIAIHLPMVVTLSLPKSIRTLDFIYGEKLYYSIYWMACEKKRTWLWFVLFFFSCILFQYVCNDM